MSPKIGKFLFFAAMALLGIYATFMLSVPYLIQTFIFHPAPMFLVALYDNAAVSLIFFGTLATWLILRRVPSPTLQALASTMMPVAVGVLPYIALFYWFSLRPVQGAFALQSAAKARGIVGVVQGIHDQLDLGWWMVLLTGVMITATVRLNAMALLRRYNTVRRATSFIGTAAAVFGVFSAMSPPDVAPWHDAAYAELMVELRPQIVSEVNQLVLKQVKAAYAASEDNVQELQALQATGAALSRAYGSVKEQYAGLETEVRRGTEIPVIMLGHTKGRAAANRLAATGLLEATDADERRDEVIEAGASTFGDLAGIFPNDGLAMLLLNSEVGAIVEQLTTTLAGRLSLDDLLKMKQGLLHARAFITVPIRHLVASDVVPSVLELHDLQRQEDQRRELLLDPTTPEKMREAERHGPEPEVPSEPPGDRGNDQKLHPPRIEFPHPIR